MFKRWGYTDDRLKTPGYAGRSSLGAAVLREGTLARVRHNTFVLVLDENLDMGRCPSKHWTGLRLSANLHLSGADERN